MEPVFRGIRVTQSLLFCVDYCLFIGHFYFGHCIVCLLQFTISDYISGIFKLLFLTCNKTIECLKIPTYFREYYNIFHITLWTSHFGSTISFLLFIYPSLQAILMNPFCCAFAHTGLNPTSFCIIFISGKAHPTSFPI